MMILVKKVAFPIACNIADDDQLKNLVDKTIDTLGGIRHFNL